MKRNLVVTGSLLATGMLTVTSGAIVAPALLALADYLGGGGGGAKGGGGVRSRRWAGVGWKPGGGVSPAEGWRTCGYSDDAL